MSVTLRKHYPKADTDFLTKIFAVVEGFCHRGKPYLSYLQSREKHDEFLMRDNLIKPLFVALGYHPQQDFSPEETISTGRIDTIIRNHENHPIVIIETQSSRLKDLSEHRRRLFTYTEEMGARFAVLSDGVRFEAWECPGKGKARFRRIELNLQDIYGRWVVKGIGGLTETEVGEMLKLAYLSKQFLFVSEEELYQEPELDVSHPTIFPQLLEDLQRAMRLAKEEICGQFEIRQQEYQEYQQLQGRTARGETFYLWELKKFKDCRHTMTAFQEWRQVSAAANSGSQELFCTETMYILFNRLLLLRIFEDKGLTTRKISNGGIKNWLAWKGFFEFRKVNWSELLRSAYETMNQVYPHLYRPGIFDWYVPESETVLRILFVFNRYNFKKVDRDILGKLYERYLDREERKRLGQFYTPEEVIDYILQAVGYTSDREIEGKKLLDPACGSGGFLVRAVNALSQRLQAKDFDAETILSQIQDSIYGFDLNPFAAHLAEMNLLFQVIDLINEAKQANPAFKMEKFNIYVTDSLAPPKVATAMQLSLAEELPSEYAEDAEVVRQMKLKQGSFANGFDFVVTNPPYVRTESISPDYKKRLAQHFKEVYEGRFDLYIFFLGLGLKMLSERGKLGYIVPAKFLVTENGGRLRQYILTNASIREVVDISQSKVFKEVGNYPVIVTFQKEDEESARNSAQIRIGRWLADSIEALPELVQAKEAKDKSYQIYHIRQGRFATNFDSIFDIGCTEEVHTLCQKIATDCTRLGEIAETHNGIITGKQGEEGRTRLKNIISAQDFSALSLSSSRAKLCKKVLASGESVPDRYATSWQGEYIIYVPEELAAPRKPSWFETNKLIIRDIATRPTATYDDQQFYCLQNLNVILLKDGSYHLKYLLAILNSRLIDFYYKAAFSMLHIGSNYMRYRPRWLNTLPIKPARLERQAKLVGLVDEMLAINRELRRLKALAGDFVALVSSIELPLTSLASSSAVKQVSIPPVLGAPKLSLEGERVYLAREAFIEMVDEKCAHYLLLYFDAMKDKLEGKTQGELLQHLCLPASVSAIEAALAQKAALEKEIQKLETQRSHIDDEIDNRVYELYNLESRQVDMVKEQEKGELQ
ncbi:hypothetical protein HKBW3S43_01049 [Candidatus Hakubella thermalkaliphila]|uniref:site-specific DNA-methyltransferase (adenine-specific) n=1 Tax=Candidatus Hakubella thermalkaliphila TaxID=2754717 RepID=A0A6V8Q943_9ACTN|nr:N-6 DNA methylase [Candidatus Hakubella thermalkaliphila]MBT9167203.1 Modification methylase PaeR7I [Bacillota bacterium]MBT9174067.1 Modification methylase PaeR7I [Bacillota bacterium]GFP24787.1 hypothetical protein HKBW3S25_00224 [Candidatus Hakubella thermalkaliphila]GFP26945.1 hypothetical protein HKBW3S33_00358 [Candidatus Hakubella thermalkaliphila]GFP35257.1 hypothetical protein HKBW3S43_01049 [Candidatus Hakubella thermalkaliphila]